MACRPIGLPLQGETTDDHGFPHKGTIMWKMREITNVLLFAFKIVNHVASSVQLMTWILLHVLAFHPLERLRWNLALLSSLPMERSPSYLFWWQLMWWVTTDVAVSVCGRSGLWPFRFVAVPVCGRFGLGPFHLVAVSVVAFSVCGRYDLLPWDPLSCVFGPQGVRCLTVKRSILLCIRKVLWIRGTLAASKAITFLQTYTCRWCLWQYQDTKKVANHLASCFHPNNF